LRTRHRHAGSYPTPPHPFQPCLRDCILGYIISGVLSNLPPLCPGPDDLPSQFPLIVACRHSRIVVGAVILVVSSLGHLALGVLAEFSMLELGSCYPRCCRLVGVGLISPSWGCACSTMRLALLLWGFPCWRYPVFVALRSATLLRLLLAPLSSIAVVLASLHRPLCRRQARLDLVLCTSTLPRSSRPPPAIVSTVPTSLKEGRGTHELATWITNSHLRSSLF
jgi:hypothetical protein